MAHDDDRLKKDVENRILKTVMQTIVTHRMLTAGDSVLVAVSGGMDSVTLIHVLRTLASEFDIRLAIGHLNHGLRQGDADRDAGFAAELAGRLNLPFYGDKRNVRQLKQDGRLSLEEAARDVRYEFLEAVSARHGFDKIATGHHANDNAEQVLMNLMRGSGPLGLSGIAPVRGRKIIRPLLELKKSEIVEYVTEKKLAFVTDLSNTDQSFRRNRIRHHLIPELEKGYNPSIIDTLNRVGAILRAEDQWLDNILTKDFQNCVAVHGTDSIRIDLSRFEGLATAAKRRIVRKAIQSVKTDLRRITLKHIDAILDLVARRSTDGRLNLPDGIRIRLKTTHLTVEKRKSAGPGSSDFSEDPPAIDYCYTIAGLQSIYIKEAGAVIKVSEIRRDDLPEFKFVTKDTAYFDMERLLFPLIVRNFRPGDRFSPLGLKGTQKLKKYFSDHKVPGAQRRRCPLLLSRNKILWIAGHRMDNYARILPATRRIIKAEVLLA